MVVNVTFLPVAMAGNTNYGHHGPFSASESVSAQYCKSPLRIT